MEQTHEINPQPAAGRSDDRGRDLLNTISNNDEFLRPIATGIFFAHLPADHETKLRAGPNLLQGRRGGGEIDASLGAVEQIVMDLEEIRQAEVSGDEITVVKIEGPMRN